ncbi:monocyte to macrophage differentiation factor 2 isoform 3-T3 [Liasis olivaceus]
MFTSRLLDFQKTRYGRFMNHRVPPNRRYQPTEYEHAANCATHAFWIVPSILGSSVLYILSDNQWETISAWIYGSGLSGLFIVSTTFHTISWKKRHLRTVEHCLHMFDRMVIYFFIAASYAPCCCFSPRSYVPIVLPGSTCGSWVLGHPTCAGSSGSWPRLGRSTSSFSMNGTSWWNCFVIWQWAFSLLWSFSPCPTLKVWWSWWLVAFSTAWAPSSSRAMDASPSPTPSGISL